MIHSEFNVLTLGNAIVDVIAQVDEKFVAREGLVKGSMNLIDEERAQQLYGLMQNPTQTSGGSAGNTAFGVASFGGKAAYMGKVRNDKLGKVFADDLAKIGVHFPTSMAESGPATARSFILVTPDGERTMNTYLGACVNFAPSDVDQQVVEAAQVTYMEGYLYDKPEAKAAFRNAAQIAHNAGRLTSVTLSDSFCVERHRADFLDLIRNAIDIVFANESEIKALYQTQSFDGALTALRNDCALAAVTRSEKGAVIIRGNETAGVEAFAINRVIDATGAGDLFASGFLYGYTKGLTLAQSGTLGCLAAAETISQVGPRPTINLRELALQKGLF